MAFQTNTMVDGQWTATTMDANTVLRHLKEKEELSESVSSTASPIRGLLTRTVIPSPVIHWIMPVKFRSMELNDVAFIGSDFVQVRELRPDDFDDHLCDVVRKAGFGSRIRNARVFRPWTSATTVSESLDKYFLEDDFSVQNRQSIRDRLDPDYIKIEDSPAEFGDIPPEGLILTMHSGHIIFLMLEQSATCLTFIHGRHRVSRPMLDLHPGTHLTVDPSSRYMAIGCYQQVFAVYSIHTRASLSQQYSSDGNRRNLRFIESERLIYVPGIILKMEFLHPSRDNAHHIILVVVVSRKGRSRMLIYEWNAGDGLRKVKAQASFIFVFEECMAICRGILGGPPVFEEFSTHLTGRTPMHHGLKDPLWTAWSRPVRTTARHLREKDDIYIAREDGFIKYLELSEDDFVTGNMNPAQCNCSIGTAFTSLDYFNVHNRCTGDLLICGGGAGLGGTFLLTAKTNRGCRERLSNWSPTQDFIIVSQNQTKPKSLEARNVGKFEQDKLFSCIGKGTQSAIVELRFGLEAKLGLHCMYSIPISQAWVIPSAFSFADDASLILLSLPASSALLKLSSDAKEIDEIDQHATSFNLESRTITASTFKGLAIQVTERSISYIKGDTRRDRCYIAEDLLAEDQFISNAFIFEDAVLFTTYCSPSLTSLRLIEATGMSSADHRDDCKHQEKWRVRLLRNFDVPVSALAMCRVGESRSFIVAVESSQNDQAICFPAIDIDGEVKVLTLDVPRIYDGVEISPHRIVSILAVSNSPTHLELLCGTQNGLVISLLLQFLGHCIAIESAHISVLGNTAAILTQDSISRSRVFCVCDSKVYAISKRRWSEKAKILKSSQAIDRVWITEINTPDFAPPKVNALARLGPNLSAGTEGGLLLISDESILLVGLNPQAKAVPRYLSISGTPSRMIYSDRLGVFVIGACVAGKSTLLFIDPATGHDLSRPVVDKMGPDLPCIPGLGNANELILDLFEWYFLKEGKAWHFIIACTDGGSLLLVSTSRKEEVFRSLEEPDEKRHSSNQPIEVCIRCWKKYRIKAKGAICAAVGRDDGIIYCAGKMLYYEALDTRQKKFVTIATHKLRSNAVSLSIDGNILYALTLGHSLEMLKIPTDDRSSFVVTHSDQRIRSGLHNIIAKTEDPNDRIHIMADKLQSIAGVWPSQDRISNSLNGIFEAKLPYSILRFRSGNTSPILNSKWLSPQKEKELGVVDVTGEHAEVLGIALDGSLCHFTVLHERAWAFLRFLYNLALTSSKVCEFTYAEDSISYKPMKQPREMMHIDGDVLRRVLEATELEDLVGFEDGETTKMTDKLMFFADLLYALHGETLAKNLPWVDLIAKAYEDLEYYLRVLV